MSSSPIRCGAVRACCANARSITGACARLAEGGARIDAYYYCPHHPEAEVPDYRCRCDCRKPAGGLVERAARELGLDPARSFVVGDRWRDIGLARTVGARGILVRTGCG